MYFDNRVWSDELTKYSDGLLESISNLPLLSSAVNEVGRNIQAPRGIILNAALTAISVVLQGLFDVRKPNNQRGPSSLMLLAIANSGERKSTAENIFLRPIRSFQTRQSERFSERKIIWKAQHDAWLVRRKGILKEIEKKAAKGLPTKEEEVALLALEHECPVRPKEFKILYEDSTSEALFHGMHKNLPVAGLISSEGGGVLEGRAFNDLSKQNAIWSGDSITVDRKTAESFELVDARLTVSIMVQESAFSEYMKYRGEKSRGSGQLARFLICHPKSTQGSRFIDGDVQSWAQMDRFSERLDYFLERNLTNFVDGKRERGMVAFDFEASRYWINIANDIESRICEGGFLNGLGDHGSKLADVICRLAVLFHCFEGFEGDVSINTLRAAEDIAKWYSNEFIRLFSPVSKECIDAVELNSWLERLRRQGRRVIKKNYIRQCGPDKLRKKDTLDAAILYLVSQGLIQFVSYFGDKTVYLDMCPWQGRV